MGDVVELCHLLGYLRDLAPNIPPFDFCITTLACALDNLPPNSFALPRLRTLHCNPIYLMGNSIDGLASPCLYKLQIAINFDPL